MSDIEQVEFEFTGRPNDLENLLVEFEYLGFDCKYDDDLFELEVSRGNNVVYFRLTQKSINAYKMDSYWEKDAVNSSEGAWRE